jgi:hypothetical protein
MSKEDCVKSEFSYKLNIYTSVLDASQNNYKSYILSYSSICN